MITVYSKDKCPMCKATKRWLTSHNVEFEEINITEHPEKRDEALEYGFTSLPIIVKGDVAFTGFAPDKLKALTEG